jgi:dipeptidyl aminopeptidase/acylaminoacyl peptidase
MLSCDVSLLAARTAGLQADLELAATLYLPTTAGASLAPGLIVGHGAGSHRLRHRAFCLEACAHGFAVLAIDFRGHGDSAGAGDGPLEQDILAAARFLRRHPAVDRGRICYRGSSMGGFYGLAAAPEAEFAAMVLLCPASEKVMLDAIAASNRGGAAQSAMSTRWDAPRLRAYFQRQDGRALAARVRCPVLIVHVRRDPVVPFEHSLMLVAELGGDTTLLALAQGTHTTAQHEPAIHAFVASWLLDQVKSACTERT